MAEPMGMNSWQKVRTWVHLFAVGVTRRMVLGARAALIDGDKVLLLRHTYTPGWHFPGGGVEPGETAEQAARREAEEETGYRVEGGASLLGLYLQRHAATNRDHVAVYVYRSWTQLRPFTANGEIVEIGWFAFDALPADTDPGTARRVAEIAAGTRDVPTLW